MLDNIVFYCEVTSSGKAFVTLSSYFLSYVFQCLNVLLRMHSGVPGSPRESFHHEANKVPVPPSSGESTWLERIVRYGEKDDLLLYVTAFIGVVMPAIVYILYHKAHNVYQRYAKIAKEKNEEEEAERRVVTIFYGSETGKTERLAEILADEMEDYSPPLINMANIDPEDFKQYKGVGLFLISTRENGKPPEGVEWFMEWMDDVDAKTKRKANFRHIRFCIFGIGDSRFGATYYNKAAKVLSRRLRSLGAKPLCAMAFADEKKNTGSYVPLLV
ncbi:hypothetical protein L596_019062 [Steinernema carpocapsae]|uniref:Flavodoxin-like domain-containing protein n=1 Tax=Steinernema carpocapsae TaxID=34508 RepID=A0A4U5N734_STECR|nr:hypothetical protein L596_019062 [Steinernema carpocapsae]